MDIQHGEAGDDTDLAAFAGVVGPSRIEVVAGTSILDVEDPAQVSWMPLALVVREEDGQLTG